MPKLGQQTKSHVNRVKLLHEWIRTYQKQHGITPSRRDMAETLNTSTSEVNYLLSSMERLGWANVHKSTARAIVLKPIKETKHDRPSA